MKVTITYDDSVQSDSPRSLNLSVRIILVEGREIRWIVRDIVTKYDYRKEHYRRSIGE